ncbi:hypothetical protein FOZ63_029940 [Perkinsus olseni]|uniref:Uncharacterized protein n=1 Tax=Perkinsus olseni TaxID=32597 RepID=A0A7J6S6G3_PEROL|nr:hypothetical protein FOZ62_026483 [Perkinsus olseni]KAF4744874.1 hypothetical protein FOZ63_029940 [Perkinsus olseni]
MRLSLVIVIAAILSLVSSYPSLTQKVREIPLNEWPMLRSHNAGTGYITRTELLWQASKNQEGNLTRQLECGVRGSNLERSTFDLSGSVFVVEGEGMCSDANWDRTIQCYGEDGQNCHDGSEGSEEIKKQLFDYIKTTASRKPRPDRLFTIQAHWQYDYTAILRMLGAGSDILKDTKLSGVNTDVIGLIPDLKYINFFQTNDACVDGERLFWALRRKGLPPPPPRPPIN